MSVIFKQINGNPALAEKFAQSPQGSQDALLAGLNFCKEMKNLEMAAELLKSYPNLDTGFNAWITSEKTISDEDMLFKCEAWLISNEVDYSSEEPMQVMLEATELPRDFEIWDSIINHGESWILEQKAPFLSKLTDYLKKSFDTNIKGQQLAKIEKTLAMLDTWKIAPEQLQTLELTKLLAIKKDILTKHQEAIANIPEVLNIQDIQSRLFVANISILNDINNILPLLRSHPDNFEEASFLWIKNQSQNPAPNFPDILSSVYEKSEASEKAILLDISKELLPSETLQNFLQKIPNNSRASTVIRVYSESMNPGILQNLGKVAPNELLNAIAQEASSAPLSTGQKSDIYWKLLEKAINDQLNNGGDEVTAVFNALTASQDFTRLQEAYEKGNEDVRGLQEAYEKGNEDVRASVKRILTVLFVARPVELMNQLSDWNRESEREFLVKTLGLADLKSSDTPTSVELDALKRATDTRTQKGITNLHASLGDNLGPLERDYVLSNIEAYNKEKQFSSKAEKAPKNGKKDRMNAYWPKTLFNSFLLATSLWRLYKAPEPPVGTGVTSRYYHIATELTDVTNPLHKSDIKPVSLAELTKTTADVAKKEAEKARKKEIPSPVTLYSEMVVDLIKQFQNNEPFSETEPWKAPISLRSRDQSIAEDGVNIVALKKEQSQKRESLNNALARCSGDSPEKKLDALQHALADFISTSIRLALLDKKGADLSEVNRYMNDIRQLKNYNIDKKKDCISNALTSSHYAADFESIKQNEMIVRDLKIQLIEATINQDFNKKQTIESRILLSNIYTRDIYARILKQYPEDKIIKAKNKKLQETMSKDLEKLEALLENTINNITDPKQDISVQRMHEIHTANVICTVLERHYAEGTSKKNGILEYRAKLADYMKKNSGTVLYHVAELIAMGHPITLEQQGMLKTAYSSAITDTENKENLRLKFNMQMSQLDTSLTTILDNKNMSLETLPALNNTEVLRNLIKMAIKLNILGDDSPEYAKKINAVLLKINQAADYLVDVGSDIEDSKKSDEMIHLRQVLEEISLQSTEQAHKPLIDSLEELNNAPAKLAVLPAMDFVLDTPHQESAKAEPIIQLPPITKEDAVKNLVVAMLTDRSKMNYKSFMKERHDLLKAFDLNLDPEKTEDLRKKLSAERDEIIKRLYDDLTFSEQGNLAIMHKTLNNGESFSEIISACVPLTGDLKKLNNLSVKLLLLGDTTERSFNNTLTIFQKVKQKIEKVYEKSRSVTQKRGEMEGSQIQGILDKKQDALEEAKYLEGKFHGEPLKAENIAALCKELEAATAKLVSTNERALSSDPLIGRKSNNNQRSISSG